MNVVGKVGGLISQGVYSVATPFHPFGGAVDVIVVQQQDGTFRSTPWYVRFGKFQGVLKGAEKVVHIAVNGVKANFHMYLDNSGEAYFIRELDSGKGSEPNGSMEVVPDDNSFVDSSDNRSTVEVCRLEHSVSDSGVTRMLVECDSLNADRIQRAESEGDRRFYEFQDEQSSLEGSVEMSDYGSNQFESLDGENYRESQGQDSEVILVSVDGHVLTAPVSASEQNTENLQLITPQFHLGPGEGAEFCAGNGEFGSNDNGWADDYISKLKSSTDVTSDNNSNVNDNDTSGHQLEVCEGDGECICQADETKDIAIEERGPQMGMDSANVKREDVFKSCLELTALAKQGRNADFDETGSSLDVPELREKSLESRIVVSKTKGDVKTEIINNTEDNSKTEDISNREDDNKTKDINNNEDGKKTEDVNNTVDDNKTEDLCKIVDYNRSEDGEAYRNDDGLNRFEDEVYRNDDGLSPSCILDSLCNNSCADPRVEQEVDEKSGLDTEKVVSDGESVDSVSNNTEWKNEQCDTSATVEGVDDALCGSMHKGNCSQIKSIEPPRTSIIEGMTLSGTNAGFEISLCGNELRAGMGLDAAAEAFNAHRISENEFRRNATSIIKNENLVIRYRERYLLWEKAAPFVLGVAAFGLELSVEQKDAIPVEAEEIQKCKENDSGVTSTSSGRKWRLWPILLGRVKTHEHTSSNSSSEDVFVDSECGLQNSQESPESTAYSESPHKQFIRTNVPTIEQVASLNLKDGQNMITFSFSTRVLGTQQVDAHIYLWKWNARIVISDVDGTITKSDVLGQFMPLVGKDWTQSGVAKLFSAIKENGYQLLFLSARAIVQAYLTRSFLLNLKQDGKALPNGPVVISPDGLFPSLYREVIRRAPHEFKIACLEDIKKLFPSDYNPFYAGFGNRDTDELSYRKIGIPKGKIFIINPKGEVAISHRIDVKSYTSLHTLVNEIFPPTSLVEQEDYNSWNFWRMPLPDVDI